MHRIDDSRPFIPLRIAVLTVSDTRTPGDDRSGDTLVNRLTEAGHRLADRAIATDDVEAIREVVNRWIASADVDVVISTGGTGFTGRDVTPEAIEPLFEKRMDGFSEVFHRISYDKIGTSTIQSRATGGVMPTPPMSSCCRDRPAPARTPGTASSSGSSTTGTCPAISWRSCRASTST
jgi:molybdenum cofactor biosynthesis protein B